MSKLIYAVDTNEKFVANQKLLDLKDKIWGYKIGWQFFSRYGRNATSWLHNTHPSLPWMLDLKLHDIPYTVANTVKSLMKLEPTFMTVHALGGNEMMRVAVENAVGTKIVAVTILTSFQGSEFLPLCITLAAQASKNGCHGVTCHVDYARDIKLRFPNLEIFCPGIGVQGTSKRSALQSKADYLIVGRSIGEFV